MTDLLNDWQEFCEDKKEFDIDHFYTLFHADPDVLTDDQLQKIFCYFPSTDELKSRTLDIFEVIYSGKEGNASSKTIECSDAQLEDLIVNDLSEKKRICVIKNDEELCEIIDNAKISSISDKNEIFTLQQSDGPDAWLKELVDDYLRASRIQNDKKIIALFEAFYGLTTNYQLVWYVGLPFVRDEFNPKFYFELWKARCEYVLTRNDVFYTRT